VEAMKTSFVGLVRGSVRHFRKFGPLCCISTSAVTFLALFLFSPRAFEQPAFGETLGSAPRAFATAITGANARLNGERLVPGATLFRGDVVTLGADSSAAVQISGKNDLVIATPGTELVIEPEGVRLRTGRVRIRLAGADTFPVTGPFFRVDVSALGGNPGSAEISISGKSAQVAAVAGVADILTDGSETPYRLDAGKAVTIDPANEASEGGQDSSAPTPGQNSNSPSAQRTQGQNSQPSGKSPKTIYIISAVAGGAALGVGLWLSSREGVSPIIPH
jgi:hypothetical protein